MGMGLSVTLQAGRNSTGHGVFGSFCHKGAKRHVQWAFSDAQCLVFSH